MRSRIKINKSEIRTIGLKFSEIANDIKAEQANINAIINDMSDAWQGNDYDTCRSIVDDKLLPNFKTVAKAIDNMGNYLSKVPNAYNSVDNVYKSKKIVEH